MKSVVDQDVDVLARTIFGEARGELGRQDGGLAALVAVGNVVMNRVSQQTWYGKTVREVCLKPWQFSCWNAAEPNLQTIRLVSLEEPIFQMCHEVARSLVGKIWPDLTGGADHYHAVGLMKLPTWAVGQSPVRRIGRHLFYKLAGDQ